MTTYVWYHAHCYDGFGAAWAAREHFGDFATYVPMDYHTGMPNEPQFGDTVYMVDYSRKRHELLELLDRGVFVTVIDHHKSAEYDLQGLSHERLRVYFDMTKSGALLTYEHMLPGREVPALIQHISDRDLWKFKLDETREVHAGLCSHPFDYDLWSEFAYNPERFEELKERGRVVLDYHQQLIPQFAQQARWMDIAGFRVPVVNASHLFSEVPDYLLKQHPEALFAAYRYYLGDGMIRIGLRSRSDFDVSEVAKQFGGGGHPQASGFVIEDSAKDGWNV